MASERETTVSNEGSSGLLFLPVVVPLLGHGSVLPVCIAVRRATIFPFSRRKRERGSFRVSVTLLVDTVPLSPLSFSIIASLLPKIIYTRDPVSQRGAYRYESNDNIYFRTEIRFTKIFPLYFLVVYFGKIGFVPSRNRRKLDRSLSVIVLLHRSLFLSFDSLVSSPIHRYYLQIPNFLFFLTRIVRCTALKFIISWKIYSCRFAVEYIIDKYRYTVKDVGGRKFKSKFNLKYIYISRIIIYLYNSVMYMRYIPCESLPYTCE